MVKTLDEWYNAFEKLYLDQKLRVSMSKNGFEKIKDEFDYDKTCKYYAKLIKISSKRENSE